MRMWRMVAVLGCLAGLCIRAEEAAPPDAEPLKLAGIELDVKKREVRVEATVCIERGILEYLVCIPNTFEHEAIFSIRCKPSMLHLGLLAIGLEPCPIDAFGLWREKAGEKPRSRVSIEVEYEKDGKKQRRRISELLVNRQQRDAAVPDEWVFTGSYFGRKNDKRVYAADIMGSVIGLGEEGVSVLQFGEHMGNPYQGDEMGLEVNADTVPAQGTKVVLVFTPAPQKPQENEKPEATGKEAKGDPVQP